jgi:hypothetical protein
VNAGNVVDRGRVCATFVILPQNQVHQDLSAIIVATRSRKSRDGLESHAQVSSPMITNLLLRVFPSKDVTEQS